MKFEVVNDKNKTVMQTTDVGCVPNENTLRSMYKAGYRFKIDDRAVTITKIKEYLRGGNCE